MPLLAQLVVEYAADLSDLESGTQKALDIINGFGNAALGPQDLAQAVGVASSAMSNISSVASDAVDAIDAADTAVSTLSASFHDKAVAAADDFSGKIASLASPITNFASDLSDKAGTALTTFGSRLQQAAQPAVDFGERLNSGIGSAVSSLQGKLQQAGTSVSEFKDKLVSGASEIVSRITSPFEQAGTVISGFGIRAQESVSTAIDSIKNKFASVSAPVLEFGQNVAQSATPVMEFGQKIISATEPLQGFISRLAEGATSLLTFGSSAEDAAAKTSNLSPNLSSVGSGLLDFASKAGMALMGVQMLAQGAMSLANSLLSPNASMEQTRVAFTQLLGSGQAAGDYLQKLQAFAASTPFDFPELSDDAEKMIAMGTNANDVIPELTAIGDAMSGLGKGNDAIQSVINTMGQMQSAGQITAGDMLQLTSQGIPGWKYLADAMHLTIPEVKDLASKGLIPAADGVKILQDGMEKTFGGGMAAQAGTFNGLLSTFQDNIGSAWRAFTGPLFDQAKGALQNLGTLVSSPAFQKFATTMGQEVGVAIKNVAGFVQNQLIPGFQNLAGFVQRVTDFFQKNAGAMQTLQSVGIVVGVMIATVLVGAFLAWAVAAGAAALETLLALAPILLIGLAIGLLVVGFMALYNNSAPFRSFIQGLVGWFTQLWQIISTNFIPVMQFLGGIFTKIGQIIAQAFVPAWQQIVQVIQTQLVPVWNQLMTSLAPIMPQLQIFAGIIGGIVVGAVILAIAIFVGLVTAVAGILPGVIMVFTGIVQIISGAIQIVSGIIAFFVDLLSGNFGKLGSDLGVIWGGIVTMFGGVWKVIQGIFMAGVGLVVGFVTGFWKTIVGIFTSLYDELIGHSIIPDMINGIVNWFLGLPGKAKNALFGIFDAIGGIFTTLKNNAFGWMSDLGANIVSGITGFIGNVGNAAQGIADAISNVIHFSLPDEGPLAHADKFMPDFGNLLARGLNDQVSRVKAAALNVAGAISGASGTAQIGISGVGASPSSVSASRAAQTVYVVMDSSTKTTQPVVLNMNGREIARANIEAEHKILSRRNKS